MEKVDILIAPVHIITVDAKRQEITDGMAAIKNGRFVYVGKNIPGRFESEKVINAEGKYLFPGFVNPHVHLFQALLKGLGRDKALIDWLNVSVRKALPKIDAEDALAAATAGCMENLRSGVTTLLDYMYCHGTNLYTLDEAVLEAFEKTG
ncbi:MAG: amidohydrolase family protein, partial [Christensenellaceae bacterium]|nr:amidohydrolase family protein [Christensenellaceae bacterium]